MANFDSGHLYLQWGGKLPGEEQWSCGLRLAVTDGSGTSLDPTPLLAPAAAAVQTFHSGLGAQISPRAKLSFVKLNYITETGHYGEASTFEHVVADVAGGGTDSLTPPNQIACAISLTTAATRGPAHRGRFYIPIPTMPILADGRISTGTRDPAKVAATDFIAALNALDTGYKVAVFSRKAGAATHRLVTGVEVGRVLDTIRRRRNKMVEAY